jgi:hypothetical protein
MWEESFICWPYGAKEADGIQVKEPSALEAAKVAVDTFRHEGRYLGQQDKVIVMVKDRQGKVHEIEVNQGPFLNDTASPHSP